MNNLYYNVFLSLITLILGIYVRYSINKISTALKKIEANNEGTKTVLYMLLTDYYEFAKENGYTSMEYKKKAQSIYEAYHNLGGNGLGTSMYEYIVKSPLNNTKKMNKRQHTETTDYDKELYDTSQWS